MRNEHPVLEEITSIVGDCCSFINLLDQNLCNVPTGDTSVLHFVIYLYCFADSNDIFNFAMYFDDGSACVGLTLTHCLTTSLLLLLLLPVREFTLD